MFLTMETSNLLTTQQAADILGLTRRRVLQLITIGKLPAQRHGWIYLIQREDLENYAKSNHLPSEDVSPDS